MSEEKDYIKKLKDSDLFNDAEKNTLIKVLEKEAEEKKNEFKSEIKNIEKETIENLFISFVPVSINS